MSTRDPPGRYWGDPEGRGYILHAEVRHHRHRFGAGRAARRHSGGQVRPSCGGCGAARNCGRRLHQYRHHPQQDHARSRVAPFRLSVPRNLRRQLSREGKDHHGRSGLPGYPGDQDRSGCDAGAAYTQRRGGDDRARQFPGPDAGPGGELQRAVGSGSADRDHRHRHQARGIVHGAGQRPHHRQQRPDHADSRYSQDPDCGGRRRDRGGVYVHVRGAGRARDPGEEVATVEETPGGGVVARMKSNKVISGDALLYAVGRQGNVDEMNLAAAGLEADSRGRIVVDGEFRTKVPNIFAAGDVIGFPSLASVSMEQGRLAAANAVGLKIQSNPATYPYGIYTIPEISFTGKTEEQLTDEDVPYEVGVAYYRDSARGQIRGDTAGRLKLIFHRETREVLGVHIIGEEATELLHIGQAVMILKGTVNYFVDTVFNYPTLAECYKLAAFNGLNKLMRF